MSPPPPPRCGRCGDPALFYFRQPGPRSQITDRRRFAACGNPEHRAAAENAWAKHFSLDRATVERGGNHPQGNLF